MYLLQNTFSPVSPEELAIQKVKNFVQSHVANQDEWENIETWSFNHSREWESFLLILHLKEEINDLWYDIVFFGPGFHSSTTVFNKEWTLLKSLFLSLPTVQILGDFQALEDSLFSAPQLVPTAVPGP